MVQWFETRIINPVIFDLMAIVNKSPTAEQLRILGESGWFNEIKGFGDFKDISQF